MFESNFEWDEVKNLSNQKKHGVSFYEEKEKGKRKKEKGSKKKDTHFPKRNKKRHPFFIHYLLLPLVKDWNVNTEYSQQPGIKEKKEKKKTPIFYPLTVTPFGKKKKEKKRHPFFSINFYSLW